MTILFGTAGRPSICEGDTIDGVKKVRSLGLDAMELEFVHSIYLKKQQAPLVKQAAQSNKITLSCHAPYYINLASPEKPKIHASINRILSSARVASFAGARDIVFHAGYYMKRDKKTVFKIIYNNIKKISLIIRKESIPVILRPEIAGKNSVFGSLEEILALSKIPRVLPCIDFSHLYARTVGFINTQARFEEVLSKIESSLGKPALKKMHIHASGINFSSKGEKNHMFLKKSKFNYVALLKALKRFHVSGVLISESPVPEKDALLMQKIYKQL